MKQPSGLPRIQDKRGAAGLGQKQLKGYKMWTLGVQVVDLEMDEEKQERGNKTLLMDYELKALGRNGTRYEKRLFGFQDQLSSRANSTALSLS